MSVRRSPSCWRSMLGGCDRAGLAGDCRFAQQVLGWVDAVDVAIARRSASWPRRAVAESAAEVLTGYGRRSTRETKAGADRAEVCEADARLREPRWLPVTCRPAMSTPLRTRPKGWMMPGGNVSASCRTRVLGFARLEPVRVFERRCDCSPNGWPVTKARASWTGQKAAVSVRRWVDKAAGMHHSHLTLGSGTGCQVVVGDRRPVGVDQTGRWQRRQPDRPVVRRRV